MKNDYEVRGEITAIIINSPKYGRHEALISTSKLDRAEEFPNTWHVGLFKNSNTFYVLGNTPRINGKKSNVCLHRWVANAHKCMVVDHRNHDGLDNTDDNLRVCTRSENGQNRKGASSHSKSGIRGVCWDKYRGKWASEIRLQGKNIKLGYFTDINEAERVAKEARQKYMTYSIEAS